MNIHEAKTHFSKLIKRVAGGEDVVITRAGAPAAVVVGIDRYKPQCEFGFASGAFQMADLEQFNAPLDPETLACCTGAAD